MSSRQNAFDAMNRAANRGSIRRPRVATSGPPPPPAFVALRREEVDNSSADHSAAKKQIEAVEEDAKEDKGDTTSFSKGTSAGRVPTNQTATSFVQKDKQVLAKCWTLVENEDIPVRKEPVKSSWTFVSVRLFEILFAVELLLSDNRELLYTAPYYFSVPARIYYSVMIYVQILRAKQTAGTIDAPEGTWLRKFLRRYPETQLPILGPLVPIFSQIASVLPSDSTFNLVYPTFSIDSFYSTDAKGAPQIRALMSILPVPRFMLALFKVIVSSDLALKVDPADPDSGSYFFDNADRFRPFPIGTAGIIDSITFGTITDVFAPILANPIWNRPLPEDQEELERIQKYWRRSRLAQANFQNVAAAKSFTSIGDFLFMSENFEWFEDCVEQALIQCKFFTNSTFLSQIPVTAGPSVLIETRLVNSYCKKLPVASTVKNWWPDVWRTYSYLARCNEPQIESDDILTAAYALANSSISWKITGTSSCIGGVSSSQRDGPYWTYEYTKADGTTSKARHRPFYEKEFASQISGRVDVMLRTQFYDYEGNQ